MDHVIAAGDLDDVSSVLEAALATTKDTDRIVMSPAVARALVETIDELMEEATTKAAPPKPRFLHIVSPTGETLLNPHNIAAVVAPNSGNVTLVTAGGGVAQYDQLSWRLVFERLKEMVDVETVPLAPPSKLVGLA